MPNLATIGEGVGTEAPKCVNLVNITVFGGLCSTWYTVYGQDEILHCTVHHPSVHSLIPILALIGEEWICKPQTLKIWKISPF